MKKKNPWMMLLILFFVFGALWVGLLAGSAFSLFGGETASFRVTSHPSILRLELNGVIVDGKKILKPLTKWRDKKFIKAVVVEVNSPGGVVGPSQEIFEELRRVREVYQKPVVVVSTGLIASGAYYAAMAADKVIVQPGTLVGSIGVIMQFTNLEKLYDWAKISRFSLTTGKYKDSGAEYRGMREDERQLFQGMIDDVLAQFVDAVAKGRNLDAEKVRLVADGRVLTGQMAKDAGLVDEIGTVSDAYKIAAQLANEDPEKIEIFEPPKKGVHWWELLAQDDDDATVSFDGSQIDRMVDRALQRILKTHLINRPLFLMPGALE